MDSKIIDLNNSYINSVNLTDNEYFLLFKLTKIKKPKTKIGRVYFRFNPELNQYHYFSTHVHKTDEGQYNFESELNKLEFNEFVKLIKLKIMNKHKPKIENIKIVVNEKNKISVIKATIDNILHYTADYNMYTKQHDLKMYVNYSDITIHGMMMSGIDECIKSGIYKEYDYIHPEENYNYYYYPSRDLLSIELNVDVFKKLNIKL